MILERDSEAKAGCGVVISSFHNKMKLADEQRVPSIHIVRQATAFATSVCVLRIYKIVEVSEGPAIQSMNVTQQGKFNPACRNDVLYDCAQTLERRNRNDFWPKPIKSCLLCVFSGYWLIRKRFCHPFQLLTHEEFVLCLSLLVV